MDNDTKQIFKIVTDIQEQMATKDDLRQMSLELHAQIAENTKAIAELAEQIRSVLGYAKEIDTLMLRVSAIEKHVGIK
jgi:uncharacterized coiled-coil DUF342 family protein